MSRRQEHRRNADLETVLRDLASALGPGGDRLAAHTPSPVQPPLLLTSTARAGSTVMMWWLARSGAFTVPSNLVSRFWRAPAVGALVERLLFDASLDHRGELHLDSSAGTPAPYGTDIGKTRGPTAPHEFWYFWRHFLGFADPPCLGPEGRAAADTTGFCAHLGALEAVHGRPLALKAIIASWDLDWLAEVLPTALFLDLRRDPLATMQSLLRIRERFFGDRHRWYSFRLPDMQGLAAATPELQVAVQVRRMRAAIHAGLATVDPSRVLRVDYEAWCADPGRHWTELREWTASAGLPLSEHHPDPTPPLRPPAPVTDPVLQAAWQESAQWVSPRSGSTLQPPDAAVPAPTSTPS